MRKYHPEKSSVVGILFDNGFEATQDIADVVGVSPATIRNWNETNTFPFFALQGLGFSVTYGSGIDHQKLKEIRDSLNEMVEVE